MCQLRSGPELETLKATVIFTKSGKDAACADSSQLPHSVSFYLTESLLTGHLDNVSTVAMLFPLLLLLVSFEADNRKDNSHLHS